MPGRLLWGVTALERFAMTLKARHPPAMLGACAGGKQSVRFA